MARHGAANLEVNAPMGPRRLEEVVTGAAGRAPSTVVDLGCGAAHMLCAIVAATAAARGVGVELDPGVVARARAQVAAEGLTSRIEVVEGDAAAWDGTADQLVVVGADHAFGGAGPTLHRAMTVTAPGGSVLLGTGVWAASPTPALREVFGDLPDVDGLRRVAEGAGWRVRGLTTSTLAEWDAFEHRWNDGVRAIGTPEAVAFADQRAAQYRTYRGVLGFAWLDGERPG